ncbi:MAG: hypothetical protein A3G18_08285 [Rhodospirillales bacterium RIFCSPLOWO2_12_FULL_58_28]|nr:MAG: hypothetical protein A3H92_09650 [Rhodospirillales bacterium RIFCSPLOWO2_02_FULL_58_16]OHC79136.1 MAG: hypothetical protein A3G18_08285 [Rhodospirillales bacterium RIFCSPLOWO2_12_FULL_58_28]
MSKVIKRQKQELAALAATPDDKIDTSDIPEVADWNDAQRGRFYRPIKEPVTIRLDADVLAWFKAHSNKYQTAINKALREYIASH